MQLVVSLVLLLACFIAAGNCQSGVPCPSVVGEPSCVCNHPDGKGLIDLRPIANPQNDPSGPKFTGVGDDLGYVYTYNPCNSYQEGLCGNVHCCQTSNFNDEITYSIASAGSEEMYIDPDGIPYVFYTGPGGRTMYVYLHCSNHNPPLLTTKGDSDVFFEYIFDLYSKHACPGAKVPSSGGNTAAGEIGIAIIVLFFFGIGVYIVMGMVIMRVKYEATGTDIIPNKAFWISFPGLIKDGTLLAISPCMRLAGNAEGYSEMKS